METQAEQMRAVLMALPGGKLLLPNTSVAEIITYIAPERIGDKPEWFLGYIRWKGYRLPVISFSTLAHWTPIESAVGAKIAILKGLSGQARLPYFALLTQGFPRLINISPEHIADNPQHHSRYAYSMHWDGSELSVPNLDAIEDSICQAL